MLKYFFYPNLYLSFFALSVLEDRLCPHGQYRHSVASLRALTGQLQYGKSDFLDL